MKKYIYPIVFLLGLAQYSHAQNLCKHKAFFKKQKKEYVEWLNSTHISDIAYSKKIKVDKDKVTLYLNSSYATDDSLKVAWNSLEQKYVEQHNMRVGHKMFSTFIFLFDLEPEQAEIIISGNQFSNSKIRIYQGKEDIKVDNDFPNIMTGGNFDIPLQNLTFIKTNNECDLENDKSIAEVRKRIGSFLQEYYADKDKETYFYQVRIDTTRSYLNKLVYHITCVKGEILDEGFFEYIKIEVKIFAPKDELNVSYDITGKYASGILCPGRGKKYYKSVETYYSNELEEYAEYIGDRIKNALINP